jgi:uncharacterized membrane protein YoaK (UPF0700 family)
MAYVTAFAALMFAVVGVSLLEMGRVSGWPPYPVLVLYIALILECAFFSVWFSAEAWRDWRGRDIHR